MKELLDGLAEKYRQIEELKAQSQEAADAIKFAEEYQSLYEEIKERCSQPPYAPLPYPVPYYPDWTYRPPHFYPNWWNGPYKITVGDSTNVVSTTH